MTIVAVSREMGSGGYEIAAAEVGKRVPGVTNVSCEAVEIPRVYPGPIM